LANLAVNARDAMPAGGRLTIATASVEIGDGDPAAARRVSLKPGRYVRLRVSDTGTDRATLDRVFEPFFTTKPMGHGTGLGLATVYGIVTQAGGSIDIESEIGLGTAFSVYLPATDAAITPEVTVGGPAGDDRGHGETVLIVAVEESLRELTSRVLTRNGYQVQVAASGVEAIRLAGRPGMAIDLLLTDVVMPQMLGD
jgi:two-component system, cell cycle sensor histidine kinase and response regulator CckA